MYMLRRTEVNVQTLSPNPLIDSRLIQTDTSIVSGLNDKSGKVLKLNGSISSSVDKSASIRTCRSTDFCNASSDLPFQNCSFFQKSFLGVDSSQSCTQTDSRSIANWYSTNSVEIVFSDLHHLVTTFLNTDVRS